MKDIFYHTIPFIVLIVILVTCTDDALFDPTGETGITVSSFLCDTTGLDTTFEQADSLPFQVYTSLSPVLAGQTISFLGFIENDSGFSGLSWSWDFGDGTAVFTRIIEHRYLDAGNYNAVFTVTNSVGITLSDTVTISVSELTTKAAVRGYAYLQGKKEHANIRVIFYDPLCDDSINLFTDKNGRYEKMEQFPECVYTIFYNDENTGFFTSETKQKVEIKQGILNELEPVILEDTCNPHILNQSPSDTIINIRKPLIHAVLADTASGIAKETLLLVFNGDTISNSSLITYNDSGFSWIPSDRLPDGTHTIYASINDSAGNGDTLIWTFNVDAMKLYITADSTVDINSSIYYAGSSF